MPSPPALHPDQADLFEGRNPLTARREVPPELRPPQPQGRLNAAATPRQRARHFAAKAGARRVRPARAASDGQTRRVIVKVRVVRMGATARKALLTHVRYVERDGAGPGGRAERFFDRHSDAADGRAFADRCENDRHHFRLIVNPEDGQDLPDLKAYARSFMSRVERDLGTQIDWIGGAHFDTGRPHLHLLLRGRRDDGRDLVMPRDYVSHGLRTRAQELATELLGPRRERVASLDRQVAAEGFTELDRRLAGLAKDGEIAMAALPTDGAEHLLRRLTHLETEGLLTRHRPGGWRWPDDLRQTLQARGERMARAQAAARAVLNSGRDGDLGRLEALALDPGKKVVGAYVGFAPLGAADGPQALVLDSIDGRLVHLRMPALSSLLALDRIRRGAVIQVKAEALASRASDQTIAEIAAARGGVYSAADHREVRPRDREDFISRHVRRLEALSREGAAKALGGGRFAIGADYAATAHRIDLARTDGSTLKIQVLDRRPLDGQVASPGYTFLDRILRFSEQEKVTGEGFGLALRTALAARMERHRQAGLVGARSAHLTKSALQTLYEREVDDVFGQLERNGKPVQMAQEGRQFTGVYIDRIHIGDRAYAVVEGPSAITLAPWREALEACRGQTMTGLLKDASVDFRFGAWAARDRGNDLSRAL